MYQLRCWSWRVGNFGAGLGCHCMYREGRRMGKDRRFRGYVFFLYMAPMLLLCVLCVD